MEFSIDTDELTKGLYRAQGIVEKKTAMPILSNVLIEARSDGRVVVTATDLEVGVSGEHEADVSSPGSITISARHLYDIIRSLPKGTVDIERMDNHWARIKSNVEGRKIEYKMMGMSPEDFQILPDVSKAKLFKVEPGVLKNMIEKTSYAVSNDETRYNLNGAYLESHGNGEFRMVATDGHRLSMLDSKLCEQQEGFSSEAGVIIPRKGLLEIKRLLDDVKNECMMGLDGSNLIFKMDNVSVVMRLIDGKFPDYKHVIPSKQKIEITLERKKLMDSFRRISILSNDKNLGIRIILEDDSLKISTSNPDLGEAVEELEVEGIDEKITIGFNTKYLLDALSSIDTEKVLVSFEDDLSPCMIRPTSEEKYTCVVMPMRI